MADEPVEASPNSTPSSEYRKRPLWQWVVIYLVLAVILYAGIYYFFLAKNGSYTNQNQISQTTPTISSMHPTAMQSNTNNAPTSNIYMTKTDPTQGTYLTDFQGMTLYTYDKDTKGISNCSGKCQAAWPPYTSGATAEKTLPTNITIITRDDGSKQFAWKDMPLYYFAGDTKAGQANGVGISNWHLAK